MGRAAVSAHTLAGLLVSTVLAVASLGSEGASPPGPALRVAVLPCTNIEASFRKFHPLFAHLRSRTGLEIDLVVPSDLSEFETMTRNGLVDFALQDPYTYEHLAHEYDDSSLLQTRGLDGSVSQAAVVVVRRDSGVSDLRQLVGKAVMFGPRASSAKWIAGKLRFEAEGIDVERDLKFVNGGCCEDIAFTVMIRSADAGVICDHFLALHDVRHKTIGIEADSLKIIAHTAPVPTRIFAAGKSVPPDVIRAITRALLDLDPADDADAEFLTRAEIGGFFRTTRSDYLESFGPGEARERP